MIQPKTEDLHLFYEPKDRLRLTIGDDRSYPTVKPVWAAPQTFPNAYLGLLDAKDKEIATIPNPDSLNPQSRAAVDEELRRRYLTSTIVSIANAKVEFGATYWHVVTNRGERDFVTQSLQENAIWMSPTHIMLIDVDGNRFEILDSSAMDERSRQILNWIV